MEQGLWVLGLSDYLFNRLARNVDRPQADLGNRDHGASSCTKKKKQNKNGKVYSWGDHHGGHIYVQMGGVQYVWVRPGMRRVQPYERDSFGVFQTPEFNSFSSSSSSLTD